jgi:hypothetical protein
MHMIWTAPVQALATPPSVVGLRYAETDTLVIGLDPVRFQLNVAAPGGAVPAAAGTLVASELGADEARSVYKDIVPAFVSVCVQVEVDGMPVSKSMH